MNFKKNSIATVLFGAITTISSGCNSNESLKGPTVANVSQSEPTANESDTCYYSSNSSSKSNGLNVRVSYPCHWTLKEGDASNVIQKFSRQANDQTLVEGMLVIIKMPEEGTPEQVKN